jgi:dTDP-L-rhamnose 4-epimerase
MRVLVTGGWGFVGRHLVEALVARGDKVLVVDSLEHQVHGMNPAPINVPPGVEFIWGRIDTIANWRDELLRSDAVVHLAAVVGVGQSQYEIRHYTQANVLDTAILLDVLANEKHRVQSLVVAGSMSSYGEGAYVCPFHRTARIRPGDRATANLDARRWEHLCDQCSSSMVQVPVNEEDAFRSRSIYAVTKATQEALVLEFGRAYGVSTTALRFFNVYGPGQSLSNPYTGVAAIFMSRLKNGRAPVIYEDGLQSRDFVSVHDVVRACVLAVDRRDPRPASFNVGTGTPTSVLWLAKTLAEKLGVPSIEPEVTGRYRKGDIRHCIADTSLAASDLGFKACIPISVGLEELVRWGKMSEAVDRFDQAQKEMKTRGLA